MAGSTPVTSAPSDPVPDQFPASASRRRCQSLTKAGEPCRAFGVSESGFCLAHDPERRDVQQRAWSAGGQHNSRKWKNLEALSQHPTLFTVIQVLSDTLQGVRAGTVPPAVGNSVASLSRSMVAAITAAADTAKLAEMERVLDKVAAPVRLKVAS